MSHPTSHPSASNPNPHSAPIPFPFQHSIPIFLRLETPRTPTTGPQNRTLPFLLPSSATTLTAADLSTYLTTYLTSYPTTQTPSPPYTLPLPLPPTHHISPDTLHIQWDERSYETLVSTRLAQQPNLSATFALLAVRGGRDILIAEVVASEEVGAVVTEGGKGEGGKKGGEGEGKKGHKRSGEGSKGSGGGLALGSNKIRRQ